MQRLSTVLVKAFRDLGVAEKVYGIAALFAVMTALLVVMAIQSVRLQTAYREDLVAPATAALNIERVNGLIFAIVMESRGIYMSTDPAKAKPFGDALTARNRELGKVVEQWQTGILPDDAARFMTFKKRIDQFIEFRRELVRRAVEISPAAGREWGKAGSSLQDILQCRVRSGLFSGNVANYLAAIIARIAKQEPAVSEVELADGRVVRISEQPMPGGGWVATHDDCTDQRRMQRILERTEMLLVTVIENIPEAIIAKDARDLRYVFVNRAAETLFGVPRSEIIGKTARELFSGESADLIEGYDRQLLTENHEIEIGTQMIETPKNGSRKVAVRRMPIISPDGGSHILLSLIQDQTEYARNAA